MEGLLSFSAIVFSEIGKMFKISWNQAWHIHHKDIENITNKYYQKNKITIDSTCI